jgi:nucleoprotein TPR
LSDRDAETANAQEASEKLMKTSRETDLLQKQLFDLGRQLQFLLKRIARLEDPTVPSDDELDQIPVVPAENIEAVITNNLVLFRNIDGLQEQNQKLLKIVRELGEKMESEEREYKEAMEKEQGEAVREAHEAIQELVGQLERQKKSSEMTIHAYMKERDALKSMLARAEKAAAGNSLREDGTQGDTDLAKELAEVQSQFEMYKSEMGVDSVRLREEAIAAQREAGQLGAALAKANAKIDYLTGTSRLPSTRQPPFLIRLTQNGTGWLRTSRYCKAAISTT